MHVSQTPSRTCHRIERTRNRHSRAVLKGNTVVIRLARNLSQAEERRHIENLLRRMTHIVEREREKILIDPFRNLLNGESSCEVPLASGKCQRFILMPGTRTTITHSHDTWYVGIPPSTNASTLHRLLWKILCQSQYAYIAELVEKINSETLRVPVRSLRVRYATSQWGSMSPKGDLMINAGLLLMPLPLLWYIILHELAHRIHANHSTAYWRVVMSVVPECKQYRTDIRRYRLTPL